MATQIRAAISQKNKYWIDKHRHYELRHFCLQYPGWQKKYSKHLDKIHLIERVAMDADSFLGEYILRAVTEGLSYTYLKTKLEIPCGRDMYYDRYRRFFWLLNKVRD